MTLRIFLLSFLSFLFLVSLPVSAVVNVSWPSIKGAVEYQGEIAEDEAFKKIIDDFKTKEESFDSEKLSPHQQYFLRVRYKDKWNRLSPFSNVASLKIEPPPVVIPPPPEIPFLWKDQWFISFMPQMIRSKIDQKLSQGVALAAGSAGLSTSSYFARTNWLQFANQTKGHVTSLELRTSQLKPGQSFGPSVEVLHFNVVYKNKAEISGVDAILGGHWRWNSGQLNKPLSLLVETMGSYDLKGLTFKSEITKYFLMTPKYFFSSGLRYRYYRYQGPPTFTYSTLGLHLTMETDLSF